MEWQDLKLNNQVLNLCDRDVQPDLTTYLCSTCSSDSIMLNKGAKCRRVTEYYMFCSKQSTNFLKLADGAGVLIC
jgi:hypothetical protein